MLPDEKIMCHRTAFKMPCIEGVVKHKCRLWCHVSGTDAVGKDIDVYGCGDELQLKLIHEVAKECRQTAASVDKVATEVKEASGKSAVLQTMLINGVKQSLPMLRLSAHMEEIPDGRDAA